MKLANKIAKLAKYEFAWINDSYSEKDLEETVKDLASLIIAELEPVKKALEKIAKGMLGCPDSVLGQGKEALYYWMWNESQEVAKEALAVSFKESEK